MPDQDREQRIEKVLQTAIEKLREQRIIRSDGDEEIIRHCYMLLEMVCHDIYISLPLNMLELVISQCAEALEIEEVRKELKKGRKAEDQATEWVHCIVPVFTLVLEELSDSFVPIEES